MASSRDYQPESISEKHHCACGAFCARSFLLPGRISTGFLIIKMSQRGVRSHRWQYRALFSLFGLTRLSMAAAYVNINHSKPFMEFNNVHLLNDLIKKGSYTLTCVCNCPCGTLNGEVKLVPCNKGG